MAVKAGMPYAESRIANYLTKQIDALSGYKSQREIAAEIGYEKPNMISMFKRGEAKVPLDKIPALAKAINVDPAFLYRLAMEQYWPGQHEALKEVFGTVVSKKEAEVIAVVREALGDVEPELTPERVKRLREVFTS